jgi:hypothetical protein
MMGRDGEYFLCTVPGLHKGILTRKGVVAAVFLEPVPPEGLLYNQSPLLSIPHLLFSILSSPSSSNLHDIVVSYSLLGPFPICSAYPRLVVRFLNKTVFLQDGVVSPTPNPQPGGPGCLS